MWETVRLPQEVVHLCFNLTVFAHHVETIYDTHFEQSTGGSYVNLLDVRSQAYLM
jgi:hypothetical protein